MKFVILCFFILFAIGIIIGNNAHTFSQPFPINNQPYVTIDGKRFDVLLAETPQDQEKGLGYRKSLPQSQAMLFIFPHPNQVGFWMKGMEFPLDIIYIRNNTIIDIFQNVPNPTTNHPETPIITPTQSANFVLEINAGLAKHYHFKQGDYVKIAL